MGKKDKKFKLWEAILASVCIVLVVEAVVPSSAIGPLQYLWWALLFIAFFVPYGLISAELGSAYQDEGGLYDWVKRAFGVKASARVAWYYWINFPLWIASLSAILGPVLNQIFGWSLGPLPELLIQLGFIWLVVFLSSLKLTESKTLINSGTIVKVLLILVLGGLGVWTAIQNGGIAKVESAGTNYTLLGGLSFVSLIIYNFLGFEVLSAYSQDMKEPKKEIPKSIIVGGLFIALFYMFGAFGVGAAIPADQLSMDSGFIDALVILLKTSSGPLIFALGVLFIYTLIANLVSWSPGINFVAMYAAKNKSFPAVFATENKHGMAKGANILNGVVASILMVIAYYLTVSGGDVDSFWTFFALSVVTFISSYLFMFAAFLKLRKIDPNHERPYKIPGGKALMKAMTFVPMFFIILALVFTCFPYDFETGTLGPDKMLIIGSIVAIIIGEIIALVAAAKNKAVASKAS